MSKQVLSIDQTHHLEELGLRTDIYNSTLLWWKQKGEWKLYATESCEAHPSCDILIPAYTLQDVLDALPKCIINKKNCTASLVVDFGTERIGYYFKFDSGYMEWVGKSFAPSTLQELAYGSKTTIIDAAYEMLCWCIQEGHITKN